MRIVVFCLACGVMCAEAAFAQEIVAPEINPNAFAPAARQALPNNEIIDAPPQREIWEGAASRGTARGMAQGTTRAAARIAKHRHSKPSRSSRG